MASGAGAGNGNPGRAMKLVSSLPPLLLSSWLAGCADPDPAAGPPVTITVTSDAALALVAFREGVDGAWQRATMKTPTTFEAVVHGPYVITSVCDNVPGKLVSTSQIARTPDEEHEIAVGCASVLVWPAITGRMIQAGRVQLDRDTEVSATTNWDFSLSVPPGTYDLLAATADRFALRRGIVVSVNTAVTPAIDLAQEGAAFAQVALTVSNAAPDEVVAASVHLDQPGGRSPLSLYRGPIATAKVAPDAALSATDAQSASIQATAGPALRARRRPFRVGGNTAYTLPDPVAGVQWDVASRDLSVSWTSVPAFDSFSVYASGLSNGENGQSHRLELSPRFVEATGITDATIDTQIAGYKPEWRIDFAREYSRQVFVQSLANGEVATSSITETVNPGGARVRPAPAHLPLAH